jgi:hypothetical protein
VTTSKGLTPLPPQTGPVVLVGLVLGFGGGFTDEQVPGVVRLGAPPSRQEGRCPQRHKRTWRNWHTRPTVNRVAGPLSTDNRPAGSNPAVRTMPLYGMPVRWNYNLTRAATAN